ncbi:MAG: DNA-3-methyladenine glycosylase family protein, partial [Burkholderiales bacterium]
LAERFNSGALDPEQWHELDDEALIVELTQVKGIGRWTAEMFLIFYMARPDVLPLDDIGLQRAMSLHYNAGRPLSKLKMRKIGAAWAPWRSVATWYLWRSLDPLPVQY